MNGQLLEIAELLQCECTQSEKIKQVCIDSRQVKAGALFVAIKGERFDGHDYVADAVAAGAVAVVVERALPDCEVAQLIVADTTIALGQIAKWHRLQHSNARVIGITGSCGKTTTRALLASILKRVAPTLASQGSYNNQFGVPLTLLQLSAEHQFVVQEMGTNNPGEIAYLTDIVLPDVAVITNAAAVHLQGLGSVEGVAIEKGAIYQRLAPQGVGVVNIDDAHHSLWQGYIGQHRQLSFSLHHKADIRASDIQIKADGLRFILHSQGQSVPVSLGLIGEHNVANALAAAACASVLDVPLATIAQGLADAEPEKHRLIHHRGVNGATLIDDSYNANPLAMQAAIRLLAPFSGRKLLVMGDMQELGEEAEHIHREIGRFAKTSGVAALYGFGPLCQQAVTGFGEGAKAYLKQVDLIADLRASLQPDDVVLIKGSRSMAMEKVCQGLIESGE